MKRSTSVGRFRLSDTPPLFILDDFQMQMIPGGTPGAAHIADDLPGLHLLAGGDADGGTVGVQGLRPAAVVQLDVVAIAAAPAVHAVGDHHRTVCGGEDGRAVLGYSSSDLTHAHRNCSAVMP